MTATPGLTPFGRSIATAGAACMLFGLLLGNFPYLLAGGLLLGAAFVARGAPLPRVDVVRRLGAPHVRAEDRLDVRLIVRWDGGGGAATLHDPIPEPFLLAQGSNFRVLPLEGAGESSFAYSAKAPRRGTHVFGPASVAHPDPLGLAATREVKVAPAEEIVVHASSPDLARLRVPAAWGRTPLAGGDRAARGVQTNDFRELRPYAPGDPLKKVNWKATARASVRDMELIVNEYEVEGKKAVWLFVDASESTAAGTNLASTFDELAAAAMTLAVHFLSRGHRVGVTVFGHPEPRLLYPDVGKEQERRITNLLTFTEPAQGAGSDLARAVDASRGFLARDRPLVFILTIPGRDRGLPGAALRARALGSAGRRPAPVLILSPLLASGASGPAGRILAAREAAQGRLLRASGLTLVRYDPKRTPLASLLAKGVIRA